MPGANKRVVDRLKGRFTNRQRRFFIKQGVSVDGCRSNKVQQRRLRRGGLTRRYGRATGDDKRNRGRFHGGGDTVTNLVTPDDKVSRNTIRHRVRLQPAFDTSWRLSRATNHETRIDKRARASASVISFIPTLDTSCDSQIDLVKLFEVTDLTGGDRYKDEIKNDTLGKPTSKERTSAYTKDETTLDRDGK
ncbi:hypothetical protein HD553DRAFT_323598 [Filobasidium floriforme]|uniref:uncharacterized protein n=1 Tax=Filobasidium floriforme TaxID=5210 RepID=UPI001E8E935C|nr:uncharacterized protein HD553DRAFT_323598 [Filobasidium floriforme]KAH8085767.1 hypothetical protein HD553DRAFT_323598 [Filobasidium floriforme]